MVRLELDQVIMRRMKEDDIKHIKALVKEGCEGTENRLVLHVLTRPLSLLIMATLASVLRCLLHSFIFALAVPVFLLIVYLKITMPRSAGVLGTTRPYWDYVGSSFRGTPEEEETLSNTYCRISGKTPNLRKARRKIRTKDKETEVIDPDRERAAGHVWLAECDGEIIGCVSREGETRKGFARICRVVVGCWYRREGLGKLLVQSLEHRERDLGTHRVYAHVPYPSKVGELFFTKLGYRELGVEEEDEAEKKLEKPEKGFLGFPLTKVFYKDL